MPVYEYKCSHCGNEFDKYVKHFIKGKVRKCPECGKFAKKVISTSSFVLKGGGWANENYSKKG